MLRRAVTNRLYHTRFGYSSEGVAPLVSGSCRVGTRMKNNGGSVLAL